MRTGIFQTLWEDCPGPRKGRRDDVIGVGPERWLSVRVVPVGVGTGTRSPSPPRPDTDTVFPARLPFREGGVAQPNGRMAAKRPWMAPSRFVWQGKPGEPGPLGSGPASLRLGKLSLHAASAAAEGGRRACGLDPDGGNQDTDPGAGPHLPGHFVRAAATSLGLSAFGDSSTDRVSRLLSGHGAPALSCRSSWLPGESAIMHGPWPHPAPRPSVPAGREKRTSPHSKGVGGAGG